MPTTRDSDPSADLPVCGAEPSRIDGAETSRIDGAETSRIGGAETSRIGGAGERLPGAGARPSAKPAALKPGDRIGLVAPSGSTTRPRAAEEGAERLEALGFRVVSGRSCRAARRGYLAADDTLRAAAFFADPLVRGIVCLKGGYGTPRILDLVDYTAAAADPKVFIGYSDITGIHLALARYAGIPTFHGPMAMSMTGGLDPLSTAAWLRALCSPGPLGRIPAVPPEPHAGSGEGSPYPEVADIPVRGTLVGGVARGRLTGGNLSLVAALAGTPYAVVPEESILFLEDIGEEPYRVDRMLTQLRLAGVFDACAGVVFGGWTNCDPKEPERSLVLREVFMDVVAPSGKPLLAGFPAGHCVPNITIPLGVEVILDADAGTLDFIEAATHA